MFLKSSIKIGLAATVAFGFVVSVAYAIHSWGNYHWARTANPFTVKLGDSVSNAWDAYLAEASTDWSKSSVLDTAVVAGGLQKNCGPVAGRVEVCNKKYGFSGWLGVASIWVSGDHIIQGTVKLNDSYFGTATYNKPEWRRLVMCQEVGHTFGLTHQDENFSNPNLGTCMDYTSAPLGPPSNEHPNLHDYEQLETIYAHLDSVTTIGQTSTSQGNQSDAADVDHDNNRTSRHEHDLGNGEKLVTFIFWTE